jgi:hypothetical protein
MIDALRFVQVVLERGIPASNVCVCGQSCRLFSLALLRAVEDANKLPFSFPSSDFEVLYQKCFIGGPECFLPKLNELNDTAACGALTVVLIDYGVPFDCVVRLKPYVLWRYVLLTIAPGTS